jgi:hypothetical protein
VLNLETNQIVETCEVTFDETQPRSQLVLMVKICIKFRLDSQAYKSTVIAKGPFFPQV